VRLTDHTTVQSTSCLATFSWRWKQPSWK